MTIRKSPAEISNSAEGLKIVSPSWFTDRRHGYSGFPQLQQLPKRLPGEFSFWGEESGSGANSEGPRVQLSFICDVSGQFAGSARAVLCGAVAAMTLLGLAPPERRRRNHAVNGGSAVATHVALRLRESMNVRPQIDMQFEISDSSAICRPFVRAKMHSQLTRRVMIEGSRAQLAASN